MLSRGVLWSQLAIREIALFIRKENALPFNRADPSEAFNRLRTLTRRLCIVVLLTLFIW